MASFFGQLLKPSCNCHFLISSTPYFISEPKFAHLQYGGIIAPMRLAGTGFFPFQLTKLRLLYESEEPNWGLHFVAPLNLSSTFPWLLWFLYLSPSVLHCVIKGREVFQKNIQRINVWECRIYENTPIPHHTPELPFKGRVKTTSACPTLVNSDKPNKCVLHWSLWLPVAQFIWVWKPWVFLFLPAIMSLKPCFRTKNQGLRLEVV